jgi:hypothetical protein
VAFVAQPLAKLWHRSQGLKKTVTAMQTMMRKIAGVTGSTVTISSSNILHQEKGLHYVGMK